MQTCVVITTYPGTWIAKPTRPSTNVGNGSSRICVSVVVVRLLMASVVVESLLAPLAQPHHHKTCLCKELSPLVAEVGLDKVEAPSTPSTNGCSSPPPGTGDAFVSLLYGDDPKWLLYALVLGRRLQQLCPEKECVLLLDKNCKWAESQASKALLRFWTLMPVELDRIPNATKTVRHVCAFTKLRALEVNANRVLFLDLDLIVRSSRIQELFDVPAPAGMLHGDAQWTTFHPGHGEIIPDEAFNTGCCINAGVLRLDPPVSPLGRSMLVSRLLKKAREIPETQATHLPEQYFLVKELAGPWSHLSAEWNWEVGPEVEMKGDLARIHTKGEWAAVEHKDAIVFHFSGCDSEPCYYIDLKEEQIEQELRHRFNWRDPRSRISVAIVEWVRAVKDLLSESAIMAVPVASNQDQRSRWHAVHEQLRVQVENLRESCQSHRCRKSGRCENQWSENSWCQKWTAEVCHTSKWGWMCSSCVLLYQCMSLETPSFDKGPEPLIGRWLDITESSTADGEEVAVVRLTGDVLRVEYDQWVGEMLREDEWRVAIKWESEDDQQWTTDGWLEGHVITWHNSSRWAHVINCPWDEW